MLVKEAFEDQGSRTQFCAACHDAGEVNDHVFGNGTGTVVKITPWFIPGTICDCAGFSKGEDVVATAPP